MTAGDWVRGRNGGFKPASGTYKIDKGLSSGGIQPDSPFDRGFINED